MALAAQYPRYGYRRIRIFLGREGHRMRPWARVAAVAGGALAGAAQAAEETRRCGSAAATGAIDVLSRLVSERGVPSFLRSDNGPEFVSRALLSWIVAQGIGTALIEPGKPWQNGVTESFNGKFRDERLSLEWFRSRAEAKVIIESWRQHFNAVRPHSSLGYPTPNEFAAQLINAAPGTATGRGAAVHGPSRPGPLHHPPRERQMQQTVGATSS